MIRGLALTLTLVLGCTSQVNVGPDIVGGDAAPPDVAPTVETAPPTPDGPGAVLDVPLELGPQPACLRPGTPGVFTESAAALGITFVQNSHGAGTNGPASVGAGVAVADLDGDGALDLWFANVVGSDELYLTGGQGALHYQRRFVPKFGSVIHIGAYAADPDGDGDVDVLFTPIGSGGGGIAVNDGTGQFTMASNVLPNPPSAGVEFAASWSDVDGDGRLDVVCAGGVRKLVGSSDPGLPERLFLGLGGLAFQEAPMPSFEPEGQAFIAAFLDVDNDHDQDIYVVNDLGTVLQPNQLLLGDGKGGFTDASFDSDADVATTGMGLAVGDIDNDGWLDLFVSSMGPGDDVLLRNTGGGHFEDVTLARHGGSMAVSPGVSWGAVFMDIDSDGDEDLYVAHGFHQLLSAFAAGTVNPKDQPSVLLENLGDDFADASKKSGLDGTASSRSPVEADLDGDGFPDLVVGNLDAAPYVYLNACSDAASWVGVRLRPTRANPSALGVRVVAEAGGQKHIRETGSGNDGLFGSGLSDLAIGLGAATVVDRLTVTWPGGEAQELQQVPVRRWVTVRQAK